MGTASVIARSGTACAVVLLSACASAGGGTAPAGGGAPPAAGGAAFRTTDFVWAKAAGSGRIDGQLTYAAQGVAYTCANSNVVLTPETPWVRQRMAILYKSASRAVLPADEVRARTPPERNQDYSNFVRRTTCDAAGHFAFSGLPEGSWFVITVARPRTAGAPNAREVAIMRRVVVRGAGAVKVEL